MSVRVEQMQASRDGAQWRLLVLVLTITLTVLDAWSLSNLGRLTSPQTAGTLGARFDSKMTERFSLGLSIDALTIALVSAREQARHL